MPNKIPPCSDACSTAYQNEPFARGDIRKCQEMKADDTPAARKRALLKELNSVYFLNDNGQCPFAA